MTDELKMDFEVVVPVFETLSNKAKSTFFHRIISNLSPQLCKTIIRYASNRLDKINSSLPIDSPYRQEYERRLRSRSSSITIFPIADRTL